VLIAETGGQNALVADSSALSEQLVTDFREPVPGRSQMTQATMQQATARVSRTIASHLAKSGKP
jgi:hypothetical protein